MAIRSSGSLQQVMAMIVARPPLATLTVGASILILIQLIHYLSDIWSPAANLQLIVPFVPPFFITRTAKRINEQKAEHDFIKDAEPYIFVSFPEEITKDALLRSKPEMLSESVGRHLNIPVAALLEMEALPVRFMENANEGEVIIERLMEDYQKNSGYGVIRNFILNLIPHGENKAVPFVMNSVLKKKDRRIKWQATLIKIAR